MPSDGKQPIIRRESDLVNGPLNAQNASNRPLLKTGEPFSFSTGRDLDGNDKGVEFVAPITRPGGGKLSDHNIVNSSTFPIPNRLNPYADTKTDLMSKSTPMLSYDTGK